MKLLEIDFPKEGDLGIFGDVHSDILKLSQLLIQTSIPPNNKISWVSTGDILDMKNSNQKAMELIIDQCNRFKVNVCKGNHDAAIKTSFCLPTDEVLNDKIKTWIECLPLGIKINGGERGNIYIFHSYPDDYWEFIEEDITERQFIDRFPVEDARYIFIGHNHKVFKKTFPYCETELYSIGSLHYNRKGPYCVVDQDFNVEFKTIV